MQKRILTIFLCLVFCGALYKGWSWYEANAGFTPWMSLAEMDEWQKQFDSDPPGGHPNYWDEGNWITAVEGRWHNGIPQYRLRYGHVPEGYNGAWYWYFNQDQESFGRLVHGLADKGFVLLDPNSFKRPDDTRRYQGVWHKLSKKAPTEAAPK